MMPLVWRFLIGGLAVCLFAAIGEIMRPKTFAGLFGAAPSIALATLGMTVAEHGRGYAATEARSMLLGAVVFVIYACLISRLMYRRLAPASAATLAGLVLWVVLAVAGWEWLLRSGS
jgi:uncharacterized membrane protein (GlpM family)